MTATFLQWIAHMEFPERLIALRKQKALTQQALAAAIGIHVSQYKRYEAGSSQPTLDVLRRLAVALSVSADLLLFDRDERGPDEDLKFRFEAVSRLTLDEKKVIMELIDGMLLKHDARRWTTA